MGQETCSIVICEIYDRARGDKDMPNHTNVNTGNSGEYFVAGELERRGFTVAVPMSNVKDFDILAINRTTYEQFAIQVKTTGYKQKKWTLSQKNETLVGDNIVYVFVSLNELDTPEYHIVPSKIVAETITREYSEWLHTLGKKGQQRNDTNIRNFFDKNDIYLDRWDLFDYKFLKNIYYDRGYKSLTDYIPRLQNIEYGKRYPEKQMGDGTLEKPFQMPYVEYPEVIYELERDIYLFEERNPHYELKAYHSTLVENNIDWEDRSMENVDVSNLEAKVVLALLLGAFRAERFCDGAIKEFLEKGCIQRWLERLKEIEDQALLKEGK